MRKKLSICCLVIFLICGGILIHKQLNQYTNSQITEKLQDSYVEENNDNNNNNQTSNASDTSKDSVATEKPKYSVDFNSLKSINSEVAGWIIIEDTPINYPIMHTSDNDLYLHHNINKEYSYAGTIFMDTRNSTDFTNYNTVLYGHNMKDGSMFASIRNYANQDYFNNHKYVYLLTPDKGLETYMVFSAYETPCTSDTYSLSFTPETFKSFISTRISQSIISCNYTPGENDNILTLSTCTTGDNRFVIHCAKINK